MKHLRLFWWRVIRRWEGELCQSCGRNYYNTIWWADDKLWLATYGDRAGLRCPPCFAKECPVMVRFRAEAL